MEGLSAAQFQTNYTFGLMKMAMRDAEAQAQEMIEMMSEVAAPAQYNFDLRLLPGQIVTTKKRSERIR